MITITVYGSNLAAMIDDARGQIAQLAHIVGFKMRLVECRPEMQLVTGEVICWRAEFEVDAEVELAGPPPEVRFDPAT